MEINSSSKENPLFGEPIIPKKKRFFTKNSFKIWLKKWLFGLAIKIPSICIVIGILLAFGEMTYLWWVPMDHTYVDTVFTYKNDPSTYLKPYNESFEYNFLLDAHSHTRNTDGKLSPQQAVEWARAEGYNGMIMTDHNYLASAYEARAYAREKYPNEFVVLLGEEYTTCRIHMGLLGITEQIDVGSPKPTDDEIKRVINETHAQGGLVIVNHIPWSNNTQNERQIPRLPDHPSREQLLDWGVDFFEVVNSASIGWFDFESLRFVQEHSDKLGLLTGSDMHSPVGAYAWTTLKVANISEEAVWEAVKSKKASFMFDGTGSPYRVWPAWDDEYLRKSPIAELGAYLETVFFYQNKGQYDFQGGYCQDQIFYLQGTSIGFFILFMLVILLILECIVEMVYVLLRYNRFKDKYGERKVYMSVQGKLEQDVSSLKVEA